MPASRDAGFSLGIMFMSIKMCNEYYLMRNRMRDRHRHAVALPRLIFAVARNPPLAENPMTNGQSDQMRECRRQAVALPPLISAIAPNPPLAENPMTNGQSDQMRECRRQAVDLPPLIFTIAPNAACGGEPNG
jgi:hypothetical protein